jgi:hypothetical protein
MIVNAYEGLFTVLEEQQPGLPGALLRGSKDPVLDEPSVLYYTGIRSNGVVRHRR